MKGLLCTPEMARAVCENRKTITRRVIVPQPSPEVESLSEIPCVDPVLKCVVAGHSGRWEDDHSLDERFRCDYVVGERRCLLTTWAVDSDYDACAPILLHRPTIEPSFWHAGMTKQKPLANVSPLGKSRPGRFLPNHLRPLMPLLEIVDVRAERVKAITSADICDEGVTYPVREVTADRVAPMLRISGPYLPTDYSSKRFQEWTHDDWLRTHFASLWDSINAERGYTWASNPWVWRVVFRRVQP